MREQPGPGRSRRATSAPICRRPARPSRTSRTSCYKKPSCSRPYPLKLGAFFIKNWELLSSRKVIIPSCPLSFWARVGAERCGSRCACVHLDSVNEPGLKRRAAVCKTGLPSCSLSLWEWAGVRAPRWRFPRRFYSRLPSPLRPFDKAQNRLNPLAEEDGKSKPQALRPAPRHLGAARSAAIRCCRCRSPARSCPTRSRPVRRLRNAPG